MKIGNSLGFSISGVVDMLELALDRQRHYNLFMIQFGAMNCHCGCYRKQDTEDVEYDFEVDAIFYSLPDEWHNGWQENEIDRMDGEQKSRANERRWKRRMEKKTPKDSQSIYFHRFLSTKMRLHNSLGNLFPKERQRTAAKHPSLIEPFCSFVCTATPFHLLLCPRRINKNKDETQPLNALFAEKSISGN